MMRWRGPWMFESSVILQISKTHISSFNEYNRFESSVILQISKTY